MPSKRYPCLLRLRLCLGQLRSALFGIHPQVFTAKLHELALRVYRPELHFHSQLIRRRCVALLLVLMQSPPEGSESLIT